jgi:hypothetical protein
MQAFAGRSSGRSRHKIAVVASLQRFFICVRSVRLSGHSLDALERHRACQAALNSATMDQAPNFALD